MGQRAVKIKVKANSKLIIITAMERGDFYACTGVRLKNFQFDGSTLSIEIAAKEGVSYTTQFIGTIVDSLNQTGQIFKTVNGTDASYTLKGDELYIRVKIESDKRKENPYTEGEVEVAWIQPVVNTDKN